MKLAAWGKELLFRPDSLTECTIGWTGIPMKSRVTITLDPEVHRLAKKTAGRKRTSVSGLIESLLRSEMKQKNMSVVEQMAGCAELRQPLPGSDPLFDSLLAKYLRR